MNFKVFALALLIFVVALVPRLYALEKEGVNPDERTWHNRVDQFTSALGGGDLMATQLTSHPGQTLLWLGAAVKKIGNFSGAFPYSVERFPVVHRAMVFPIILITSATAVCVFLLLLKIAQPLVALAGGLFVGLDPFFIANSRVFQLDALLASFMILSTLSLLIYLKDRRWAFLVFSAVMGGLAILTKLTAVFLIPYILLVLVIDLATASFNPSGLKSVTRRVFPAAAWLGMVGLVFVVLYPAMWSNPILALKNVKWLLGQQELLGAHPGTSFFLGKVVPEPGTLYYLFVLALRSTPISFIFGAIGLVWGIKEFLKTKKSSYPLFLILYSLFFILQITIASKKGNRYALPAVLGLDVLAAYGILNIKYWILNTRARILDAQYSISSIQYRVVFASLLFGFYLLLFVPLDSRYLSFYNPLFGGAKTARKTIVMGWGEGFYEVAQYLNQKPNAKELKVLSFFESSLTPLFKGKVFKFGDVDDSKVDYLVFYVSQIQRGIDAEIVEKYFSLEKPEYIVKLNGVEYCWIFTGEPD